MPTQPFAEFTMAGGIRPKIANIDFDLGVTYFAYPGEALPGVTNGINYWEAVIRGDRKIGESIRIASGYAYSPNVSNTGAWSQYVAAGLGFDLPTRLLPQNLGVLFKLLPDTRGSVIRLRSSVAFHYLPISIGRQA